MEKEEKNRKLEEWKAKLEHLQVQLHLGIEDAKDEFEKQKKQLEDWLNSTKHKLSDIKDITKDKATNVKSGLEELRLQAALGKAETEQAFQEQREKMSHKIHDLKHKVNEAYYESEGNAKEMLDEAGEKLEDFHTRFDLFRLQAHLGKMEAEDAWKSRKVDISNKMEELKTKLEKGKEVSSEKWDHFSTEMSEAWKHVKKAIVDT